MLLILLYKKTNNMGILKKSGSWRTNKHNRRVTFGCEEYSTKETPQNVKLHDGMSEKNRTWFNFIDFVIFLRLDPELAWNRVPEKYLDFVWNTIFDVLDKYWLNGSFVSQPLGHPRCKIISEKYNEDITVLAEWVYQKINKRKYRTDYLEKKKICKKCGICNLEYDKLFNKEMCYTCDFDWNGDMNKEEEEEEEEDENWKNLKENYSPSSVIPEYPEVIRLQGPLGEIEI